MNLLLMAIPWKRRCCDNLTGPCDLPSLTYVPPLSLTQHALTTYSLLHHLTQLAVSWKGFPVHQTPYLLVPVFDGGRLVLYGEVEKGGAEQGEVELTGKLQGKPFSTSISVDLNKVTSGDLILKLGARSMIR